jgi:ribosome-binding factor A
LPNRRSARVADLIQQEISDILLNEMKDPGLGFVTVTSVDISQDLRHAKVYFSLLGSTDDLDRSLKSLERATGFIRSALGKRIRLRHVPELLFRYDDSFEYAQRISNVIKQAEPGINELDGSNNSVSSQREDKERP